MTPEPAKRPRSSYLRFAAELPNECLQSDFTHYGLAGGADAEVLAPPFADYLKLSTAAMGRNFGDGHPLSGLRDLISIGPGLLWFGIMLYRVGRILASLLQKLIQARNNWSRSIAQKD